jgi:hypothetical protein
MEKMWKFLKFNQYQFKSSDQTPLILKFNSFSRKVSAKNLEGNEIFNLHIDGMFRSSIIISDNKENQILKLDAKHWWKSNWKGILDKNLLEIRIVNNPWVEYQLLIDGAEVLTYGIKRVGFRAGLSVQQFKPITKYSDCFYVILFCLIRPALIETMGNKINMSDQSGDTETKY